MLPMTPLQFVHCFEHLRLLAWSGQTVAAEVSQPKTSLPDAWDLKKPVKLVAAATQSMPFKGNHIYIHEGTSHIDEIKFKSSAMCFTSQKKNGVQRG